MFNMNLSYSDAFNLYEENQEVFRFYRKMMEKEKAEESAFRKAIIIATFGQLPY